MRRRARAITRNCNTLLRNRHRACVCACVCERVHTRVRVPFVCVRACVRVRVCVSYHVHLEQLVLRVFVVIAFAGNTTKYGLGAHWRSRDGWQEGGVVGRRAGVQSSHAK